VARGPGKATPVVYQRGRLPQPAQQSLCRLQRPKSPGVHLKCLVGARGWRGAGAGAGARAGGQGQGRGRGQGQGQGQGRGRGRGRAGQERGSVLGPVLVVTEGYRMQDAEGRVGERGGRREKGSGRRQGS